MRQEKKLVRDGGVRSKGRGKSYQKLKEEKRGKGQRREERGWKEDGRLQR